MSRRWSLKNLLKTYLISWQRWREDSSHHVRSNKTGKLSRCRISSTFRLIYDYVYELMNNWDSHRTATTSPVFYNIMLVIKQNIFTMISTLNTCSSNPCNTDGNSAYLLVKVTALDCILTLNFNVQAQNQHVRNLSEGVLYGHFYLFIYFNSLWTVN